MGKIIKDTNNKGDYDEFVKGLQQMYNGSRKWGSVRVAIKRGKLTLKIKHRN